MGDIYLQIFIFKDEDRFTKRTGLNTSITPDLTVKIFGGPNYWVYI